MALRIKAYLSVTLIGGETVSFKVVWKKQSYDITFNPDEKASKLKEHLQTLTGKPLLCKF